jgi:DNA-binding MarR family transcriptional regulator
VSDHVDPDRPPLLGLLLRLLAQHWNNHVDAALKDAGFGDIRPAHANVFALVPADGIQVVELARRSQVAKQSMAQVVEQLETLGYVERRPDPADGRAKRVFLTERGLSVRPVGAAAGRQVEADWARLTSRDDVEGLRARLQQLLVRLAADGPGAGL